MFWDSHAHQIGQQQGGFIIALENGDRNVISNDEIKQLNLDKNFIPVEYVTASFQDTATKVVKYHPRNECYTKSDVIKDIQARNPRGVIIDTLNEPYWCAYDYWELAKTFPQIQFLLSHAGGYKLLDFIEICEFNKNVWLDFSYTQNHFGMIGSKPELKAVTDIMRYAFGSTMKDRILFGSDYPYVNQEECFAFYKENVSEEIYMSNFEALVQELHYPL